MDQNDSPPTAPHKIIAGRLSAKFCAASTSPLMFNKKVPPVPGSAIVIAHSRASPVAGGDELGVLKRVNDSPNAGAKWSEQRNEPLRNIQTINREV
jgi:hypothetical protein